MMLSRPGRAAARSAVAQSRDAGARTSRVAWAPALQRITDVLRCVRGMREWVADGSLVVIAEQGARARLCRGM